MPLILLIPYRTLVSQELTNHEGVFQYTASLAETHAGYATIPNAEGMIFMAALQPETHAGYATIPQVDGTVQMSVSIIPH